MIPTYRLPTLKFSYDPWTDIITIEGIKYAGSLFRDFGGLLPVGKPFRIVRREPDGTTWIENLEPILIRPTTLENV